MLEMKFEEFLTNEVTITSKEKAVRSRMSKARAVEKVLGESLDYIISTDEKMYNALLAIDFNMNNKSGAYSNSLRKYYTFKTGKIFPRIAEYHGN
ncbi:MAG: hypothetical protein ACYDEX_05755 [Mobilitalea sp.]